MRNPTRFSLLAALLTTGFLLSSPANAATAIGTLSGTSIGNEAVQEVHYRPYKHFHKKRFDRRHFRAYRYHRPYRQYRSYYHDDDDVYVYRRPAVRFGLGVKKHRYYDDDDDY